MKWLNDKDSVTQEELEKNKNEAYAARAAAFAAYAAYAARAADYDYAAYAAAAADYDYDAVYWVNRYFEETGEDRAQYEKELNK